MSIKHWYFVIYLSEVREIIQHGGLKEICLTHLEAASEGGEEESDVLETEELSQGWSLVDLSHVQCRLINSVEEVAQENTISESIGKILYCGIWPGYSDKKILNFLKKISATTTTCDLRVELPVWQASHHTVSTILPFSIIILLYWVTETILQVFSTKSAI